MGKARLEAFSDGVLAIIITIMVLEFRIPEESEITALLPLLPVFLSYVLSFVFIGIYWNNHHHLMHAVHKTNGTVLWANMHLLFWLSLIPFVTGWMDHHPDAPWPVALYGIILLMAAIAYTFLVFALLRCEGQNPQLAKALGSNLKGNVSLALYILAIPSAFFYRPISFMLFVIVALIWFIPERRIEALMRNQ